MHSGGQLVVKTLMALGARRGFGVPGESYLAVLDAFVDASDFDFTICRNEGGAAFMAEAWSKLTGEVGLCFVTRGPGATNASIGVHSAMQASTPMILFVGQVDLEHQGREAFQELDYRQVYGPIAKYACEITDAARVPEIVTRCWTLAQSGRPGPVVIALPEDMLRQMADANVPEGPIELAKPLPDPTSVAAVINRLNDSERPVILVGGNGWTGQGKATLQSMAEAANIPVVTAFRFHDLIDNSSPMFAGEAGVGMTPNTKRILKNADTVIAINARFGEMTTDAYSLFGTERGDQWIGHCHVCGDEIGKVVNPDLACVAGPNEMVAGLANAGLTPHTSDWTQTARQGFLDSQSVGPQIGNVDMGQVTATVQAMMPDDTIVTNGAGNFAIWSNKFLSYGAGQRLLAPQSGAMGYGVPAAVAAKIEHPDRTVICFAGDGDFQMNFQELGTALQSDARPIVLIVNNGTYGTIRMHQEKSYPARISGTNIVNPDFMHIAAAYGMMGAVITETAQFEDVFERALVSPTGAIIDLRTEAEAITPRTTITDLRKSSQA